MRDLDHISQLGDLVVAPGYYKHEPKIVFDQDHVVDDREASGTWPVSSA